MAAIVKSPEIIFSGRIYRIGAEGKPKMH